MAISQQNLTKKTRAEIDSQLKKYYQKASQTVIAEFENTYNKIKVTEDSGRVATPADLYKLDKYWNLQSQLNTILQKLGDKQIALFTKAFQENWWAVYNFISLDSEAAYYTLPSNETVLQLINQIWCADGKSWSQRIWVNNNLLADALNEGLIRTITNGTPPAQLKKDLMEVFNVSYHRADALVRTELTHIQTQAAKQRYTDYGIKEVEIYVDEDERTCPICAKLEGKRYLVNAPVPIPAHPRCRCCIVPVIN